MALDSIAQMKQLIENAETPLILLSENPSGDIIGAGYGLYHWLVSLGKKPTIAFSDPFKRRDQFAFLPIPKEYTEDLSGLRDFILIFNTKNNKISNVRTEEAGDEMRIFITPKKDGIDPRDFSFVPAQSPYDMAFVLGCAERESLGNIYENHADILYEVPLVNIDSQSNNDAYGQVNLVKMTASGVSEIVYESIKEYDSSKIDAEIAKCFLTGIISATESFQKKNTTPNSLHEAAELVEKGANQQVIIQELYKSQPVSLLRLWGRIMAKLEWDEGIKMVWASVTLEDFVQSRSKSEDLWFVLDKIESNFSRASLFLLFFQNEAGKVQGIVKAKNTELLEVFDKAFRGEKKGDYYVFTLESESLYQGEKESTQALQEALGKK